MEIKQVLETTKKAVKDTGKSFDKIPKKSILEYLERQGVTPALQEVIYRQLSDEFKGSEFLAKNYPKAPPAPVKKQAQKVNENTDTDVPQKTPRKTIFGKITKITHE